MSSSILRFCNRDLFSPDEPGQDGEISAVIGALVEI